MLSRQIGSLVRGRISTGQVLLACVLGAMLGFLPGFARAPGAMVALSLLLLVLNVPLGVALATFAGSRLLSYLLLPVSFAAGRALLDGPTQGLFRAAINAPVLALFGLQHYVTTGGLLVGALVGVGIGLLVGRGLRLVRLRLAAAADDHAKLAALATHWWARLLLFVFVGRGHGPTAWKALAEQKGGRPVRIVGVVIALLLVGALFALQSALTGPMLASALRSGLAQVNGATVDIDSASLDLAEGRLVVRGLALADPAALDTNVFSAAELTADVSGLDLLRRRVHLEHVAVREAKNGAPRASRGSLVGKGVAAPPPAPTSDRTLQDYVKDYQLWRDRLAQVRHWLERLAPSDATADGAPGAGGAGHEETLGERLQREAEESGYANVVARHLVDGAPTLLVSDLQIDGLTSAGLPDETLDVHAENLSTQPSLVDGAPHIAITSRSGHLSADLGLGSIARGGGAASANRVAFSLRAFPVDRIADQLRVGGEPPMSGGTLDVVLDGGWSGGVGRLDLPLAVTLHDSTLRLGGHEAKVSQFTLPIGLRGPLDDLSISIDDDHLVDALRAAGAAELSKRVEAEKDKLVGQAAEKVDSAVDKALDKAAGKAAEKGLGDALGGLLGGKKKDKDKPKDATGDSNKGAPSDAPKDKQHR